MWDFIFYIEFRKTSLRSTFRIRRSNDHDSSVCEKRTYDVDTTYYEFRKCAHLKTLTHPLTINSSIYLLPQVVWPSILKISRRQKLPTRNNATNQIFLRECVERMRLYLSKKYVSTLSSYGGFSALRQLIIVDSAKSLKSARCEEGDYQGHWQFSYRFVRIDQREML